MTVEYKCIDVYKKPENPMEWLPCPRCGLRPLVWEFDNGRATACGCEGLLDKNGLNDKMDVFINRLFNENNHIRYLKDIGYHKIGSIFKYNTGMEKIELEVIEIDDSSCDGCVFNNRGYYCMYSCCCNIDREDNTNVIYKEVKRS